MTKQQEEDFRIQEMRNERTGEKVFVSVNEEGMPVKVTLANGRKGYLVSDPSSGNRRIK